MFKTAPSLWTQMAADKSAIMDKTERYAALTIPKICYPDGVVEKDHDNSHDYQSIGAQCVNHLTNKLMLAMFAPSRANFRIELGEKTRSKLAAMGQQALSDAMRALAEQERKAGRVVDSSGQRPKLYASCRHLIIAGNVLLHLEKEIRVMGLRYFCVKRNAKGKVIRLIIKERVKFDELDLTVQGYLGVMRYQPEREVDFYKVLELKGGDMCLTQWVEANQLPKQFNGKWPEEECPYKVLTWDLSDEADYATGLVEEYIGDLEALSVLAEATVDGAVLGAEQRYMVDPAGVTSVDDLKNSKNGDAIAGRPEDIDTLEGANYNAVKMASEIGDKYEKRLGRGFLLGSAVTRDAERVTAEEVRLTAMELESSFGGVYSNLAVTMQRPLARWALGETGIKVRGLDLEIIILTGLDALSRGADIENLRLALTDLGNCAALPEPLLGRIKWRELSDFIGAGRQVDLTRFLLTDDEYAAQQEAAQQSQVAADAAVAGASAGARASVQGAQ